MTKMINIYVDTGDSLRLWYLAEDTPEGWGTLIDVVSREPYAIRTNLYRYSGGYPVMITELDFTTSAITPSDVRAMRRGDIARDQAARVHNVMMTDDLSVEGKLSAIRLIMGEPMPEPLISLEYALAALRTTLHRDYGVAMLWASEVRNLASPEQLAVIRSTVIEWDRGFDILNGTGFNLTYADGYIEFVRDGSSPSRTKLTWPKDDRTDKPMIPSPYIALA